MDGFDSSWAFVSGGKGGQDYDVFSKSSCDSSSEDTNELLETASNPELVLRHPDPPHEHDQDPAGALAASTQLSDTPTSGPPQPSTSDQQQDPQCQGGAPGAGDELSNDARPGSAKITQLLHAGWMSDRLSSCSGSSSPCRPQVGLGEPGSPSAESVGEQWPASSELRTADSWGHPLLAQSSVSDSAIPQGSLLRRRLRPEPCTRHDVIPAGFTNSTGSAEGPALRPGESCGRDQMDPPQSSSPGYHHVPAHRPLRSPLPLILIPLLAALGVAAISFLVASTPHPATPSQPPPPQGRAPGGDRETMLPGLATQPVQSAAAVQAPSFQRVAPTLAPKTRPLSKQPPSAPKPHAASQEHGHLSPLSAPPSPSTPEEKQPPPSPAKGKQPPPPRAEKKQPPPSPAKGKQPPPPPAKGKQPPPPPAKGKQPPPPPGKRQSPHSPPPKGKNPPPPPGKRQGPLPPQPKGKNPPPPLGKRQGPLSPQPKGKNPPPPPGKRQRPLSPPSKGRNLPPPPGKGKRPPPSPAAVASSAVVAEPAAPSPAPAPAHARAPRFSEDQAIRYGQVAQAEAAAPVEQGHMGGALLGLSARSQPDLQQGEDGLSGVRTGVHALALELAAMKGEVEALKAQDAVQRQALEDARSLLGALRLRVEAQELEVNTARAQAEELRSAVLDLSRGLEQLGASAVQQQYTQRHTVACSHTDAGCTEGGPSQQEPRLIDDPGGRVVPAQAEESDTSGSKGLPPRAVGGGSPGMKGRDSLANLHLALQQGSFQDLYRALQREVKGHAQHLKQQLKAVKALQKSRGRRAVVKAALWQLLTSLGAPAPSDPNCQPCGAAAGMFQESNLPASSVSPGKQTCSKVERKLECRMRKIEKSIASVRNDVEDWKHQVRHDLHTFSKERLSFDEMNQMMDGVDIMLSVVEGRVAALERDFNTDRWQ